MQVPFSRKKLSFCPADSPLIACTPERPRLGESCCSESWTNSNPEGQNPLSKRKIFQHMPLASSMGLPWLIFRSGMLSAFGISSRDSAPRAVNPFGTIGGAQFDTDLFSGSPKAIVGKHPAC